MSKFKGKRMVDEDLIKKLIDLQPGGGEYSAGTGIDISAENEISVDTDTVALKSELFSGDYDDLTNKPDLSIYAESADLATVATTGAYSDLSGTPTLATIATTGDYDDLTNKPTIPTVDYPVTDVQVDGVSVVSSKVASITMPTVPTKTSQLTNDSGFITGVAWGDVTGKPSFATVATTGDYSDLTNKPTIPTVDYPVTDVTVNGTSVVSSKVAAITVPTSATSTSTVSPTTETLTFTYSDNTTGTITFITAATVSTTTTLS